MPGGRVTPPDTQPRAIASGVWRGSPLPPNPLLDEEHLLVLRQRPELVGDDALQLVRRLADFVHRPELLVAGVNRHLQALQARIGVRRFQLTEPGDQLVDEAADLTLE